MTEPDQLPRPVVRRGASLDVDQTGRQLLEKRQQLTAPQLPADDNVTSAIYAVNLENVLREIEADRGRRIWCFDLSPRLTRI